MADILSDIYPVPVSFVDGQQPTARFLNAWAAQIDVAFAVLARIIGDFDGESSEQATYISNLVRTMGSMGWLDSRLPRGLKYGLADFDENLPRVVESISGGKEALLSFIPDSTVTTLGAGTISGWTKKNVGSASNPGANLTGTNQWTHWSRKIYTTTMLPVDAQIQYEIDPDSAPNNATDYYDTYGPSSGANVVPNIYEIASVVTGGAGDDVLTTLCTIEEEDSELWVEMPTIRRAMNPSLPFDTSNSTPLNLISGTVQWVEDHAPRYTVPPYIFELGVADESGQIPEGLCSLWIANGSTIIRLVNQNSEEQIRFFVDEGDRRHVRIEIPEGYTLPHQIEGQEDLSVRYIIAFAGVGLADAIAHVRARVAKHAHDGAGEDSLIYAASISNRFNPSQYTESQTPWSPFPQYLLRAGFLEDDDTLNRDNAFLGALLIGAATATANNTNSPNDDGESSHKIYLGSFGDEAPNLFFDVTDTSTSQGDGGDSGKIFLGGRSVRIGGDLFVGDKNNGGWINAEDAYFSFGAEGDTEVGGAVVASSKFHVAGSTGSGHGIGFGGETWADRKGEISIASELGRDWQMDPDDEEYESVWYGVFNFYSGPDTDYTRIITDEIYTRYFETGRLVVEETGDNETDWFRKVATVGFRRLQDRVEELSISYWDSRWTSPSSALSEDDSIVYVTAVKARIDTLDDAVVYLTNDEGDTTTVNIANADIDTWIDLVEPIELNLSNGDSLAVRIYDSSTDQPAPADFKPKSISLQLKSRYVF
jgi:hypothetical protein